MWQESGCEEEMEERKREEEQDACCQQQFSSAVLLALYRFQKKYAYIDSTKIV
jgi:hypothetical protein